MNTKLLKQKILDLAIRGKLTQQLKSDGTAKDLLTQICAKVTEPAEVTKRKKSDVILSEAQSAKSKDQGQIIPLDKNEAPFEIPANWEWVRLGDVFNMQAGKNIATGSIKSEFEDGLFPCYGGNGLRGYVSCYNREGDFPLIGRQGALCGNVNRATGKFYATEHAVVVEVPANINVSCACHFLTQLNLNQYASSTAQPGLSVAKINEVPIPLPPLAEQQRIVAKIEEAFAEIDAIEKNKELLKTHIKQTRQKILDLAIHGKLVPQNKSDEPASVLLERITRDNPHYEKLTDVPFEIPESWEWVKLGDVGKWQSGTTPSKSNSSYYKDGTIPWLNTGDLNDGIICEIPKKVTEKALAETSLRLNEAGSVCIAMYGATIGKIGILSMPATTNQACCVCNNLKNFVNQMWLFYFLKNHKQEFIEAGFGGAQPNISKEKITATLFPLPPLVEQKRIVNKIEEIFASLDAISRHLD